jgi:hypothetical protein
VAALVRRGAPALGAAPVSKGRGFFSYLVVVTLVACGGATRPDRDAPRQQGDDVSRADAAHSQRDAGEIARFQRDAGDDARLQRDAGDDDRPRFCTANIAPGLYVTFDRQTAACDELAVVATDRGYTDALKCSDLDAGRCACFGATERPGSYEITVSRGEPPVELARSGPIAVTATWCHVVTQSVDLQLASLPAAGGVFIDPDAGGK